MDEKLTHEDYEWLASMIQTAEGNNALCKADELQIIDILIEACKREKIDIAEKMMIERFRIQ